ncbi:multi antimicrobial extrusion protein [Chloropicon primus]|uniref:Protein DETOXIFICATION n=2 Tax=Chloropicon primus TaxID=1764295 RepID=A0A5B8MPS1_9CHLO|nr:multi antimicrobial extrusion protein [Chloropicon primus]UPR00806.1 multi antimicrobial extrusion protein [Chloropicon primus]|eukprot:QDZ21595.1 multi antimicrobial extrusion protein [Chloropicon primus]
MVRLKAQQPRRNGGKGGLGGARGGRKGRERVSQGIPRRSKSYENLLTRCDPQELTREEAPAETTEVSEVVGGEDALGTLTDPNLVVDGEAGTAPKEASVAELLKFTVPTMGIWLASPILSLVDATVVGSQSVVELAALTPGTVLVDYLVYVFTFLGIATTNILSVTVAERNAKKTESRLNDALTLGLVCGVVLGGLIFVVNGKLFPMVIGAGAQELVKPASVYASIRALGVPFALVGMVLNCAFLASKNTRIPLISTLIGGFVNLGGDIALVNYLGWGIAGAAWATVLSQLLTVVVLCAYASGTFAGMPFRMRMKVPKLSSLLEFVRIAGPVSIILLSKVVVFSVVSLSAANLGATASAAHTLLFNVFLFFCVPGDSLNQCAQTFLPPVAGILKSEKVLKTRIILTGNVIGVANVILALLLIFCFPQILTTDALVTRALQGCGALLSLVLFLHPFGISTEGILMATKEFDYLLGTYIINMLCMLGTVKLIGATGPNLSKVWISLAFMQVLRLAANMRKIIPQQMKRIPKTA